MAVGTDTPIGRVERLAEAAPILRIDALALVAVGLVVGAVEILVFDWDAEEVIGGTVLFACIFGVITYLSDMSKLVPRGTPQDAPTDVKVELGPRDFSTALALATLAIVAVPVIAAFDWLDLGAGFAPGPPLGYAAAALVTLARVRAWERANRRRVLFEPGAEEGRPYAGRAL